MKSRITVETILPMEPDESTPALPRPTVDLGEDSRHFGGTTRQFRRMRPQGCGPGTSLGADAHPLEDFQFVGSSSQLTTVASGGEPVMVGPAGLARMLELSTREVRRLRSRGLLPEPDLQLSGRCQRWSVAGLRSWIDAGCPPSEKWKVVNGKEKRK